MCPVESRDPLELGPTELARAMLSDVIAMLRSDLRFYVPATAEDELALVRTRVRERREGLKVSAPLFGGSALAGAGLAMGAWLAGNAAVILMPWVVILVALPAAGLAIVALSSLIWRGRLRRLLDAQPS